MALLPWNDDEEQDEITGVTPIKRVVSVQDGAWQPSASGANEPAQNPLEGNYLFSEEKAQFDQQQEQRRQAEAQAAAAAAAAAAQARAAAQAQAQQVENVPPSRRAANNPGIVEAGKNDDGWKKYYDKAFQQERSEQGFFGRLIDGGAASRNAEVVARAKYQRELRENNEVERARAMGAYNSNLAYGNSRRAAALTRAGAADKVNPSILEQIRGTANNLRTMSLYDSIFGVDDKHKTGADDLFRFGGNVIQGIGTAPTTGTKSLIETATGRGTDYETGEEKDLNSGERIGRAISGSVDIAGAFLGGSQKLIRSVAQKAAKKTATEAEKALLKRAVAEFVVPALIEGGENGVQAAADYFGEGGALRDENGEIDLSKVGQFLTQVGSGAALGTLAGGVFAGTAAGVNRARNASKVNEGSYVRLPGEVGAAPPVTDGVPVAGNARPAQMVTSDVGTPTGQVTPVSDGVAKPQRSMREFEYTPIEETPGMRKALAELEENRLATSYEAAHNELRQLSRDAGQPELYQKVMKAISDGDMSQAEALDYIKQGLAGMRDSGTNAKIRGLTTEPAADGVSHAGVTPVARDVPVVPTEQVRALKEARVGKSQAEEAVINQKLQEIESSKPKTQKDIFTDKALMVDDITNAVVERVDQGDISGARAAATRLYEDPEYGASTARGQALLERGKKLEAFIKKNENAVPQDITPAKVRPQTKEGQFTGGRKFTSEVGDPVGDSPTEVIRTEGGYIRVIPDSPYAPDNLTSIMKVMVDEGSRRQGIGSNLLKEAMRKYGRISAFAENEASQRMNYKLGMRPMQGGELKPNATLDETLAIGREQGGGVTMVSPETPRPRVDKSESGVNKAGTLTRESENTLVSNDGWESYRDNTIKNYEKRIRWMETRGGSKRHIKGLKDNLKALQSAKPNEVYRVNPTTGKTEVHPASELLKSFSKAIGDDVPPIAIGNVAEHGSSSRLPANWAGASGTYVSQMSRLDYKKKNAVYHETMHHIDHFVRGYKGDNPKMNELKQLREAITLEDMKKFKAEDWRASNKAEYVAHAMDSLLDGRIKAGQLGASVLKYIKSFFSSVKEALSSSHAAGRKHTAELAEYVKRLDAAIHDAGKTPPKQKPLSPGDLKPVTSNLPPSMGGDVPVTPVKPKKTITPEQKSINEFAKRVFSNTDLHKDFQRRLAKALGLEKDTGSSVAELLEKTSAKVSARDKTIIQNRFNELEKITTEYNNLMKQQRKGYQKGKISGLDEAASRRANKLIDAYGRIERDLNGYVRKIKGKGSIGNRIANVAENLTGARNASILSSVGGVSRNISQELGANILEAVLHPVRMARGVVHMPAEIARAYKRTAREFTVKPKTVSEVFPYAIGNTYRLLMSPVTGIANVRKGVARDALAESLLRAQGGTPTRAEIKKFAGAMGADSEVVANNLMGIMNGMTSHGKGLEVMRSYQEFIKTGSPAAKANFLANTERSSNLAAKMSQVASESNDPKIRIGAALMNTVFPFVNTATNLAKTAATYNLNPVSRSINDEVLRAVRANPANVLAILKNKAVTYGVLGGVYALYEADVIGYNDGEEVDKPRGVYIDMGDGNFHAVRATPIELPIAAVVTAAEIAKHASEGDMRPANYYAGIIGNSLPYVDSTTNLAAATGSAVNAYLGGDGTGGTDDNGYAAKAYGVNMAKSFVPYSNHGLIPAINQAQGKSTNAKTVYDKDMGKWFDKSLANSFGTNPFTGTTRDSLKDSRDAAGRVRTVDQQGLFGIKKTINDKDTATHNDTINKLVTFGRQNGLGKGTKDMFNTYDTGKNNNFKSTMDSITFLDVADGESPDNAKKLEKNEKLTDLSRQMREGFFGTTGMDLLTLDGKELYSDVSVPVKSGAKNSSLPINMQSIKNAIAATDLPKEQRDRMYELSQANQALYERRKNKEITYDQEQALKAQNEEEYVEILSGSKNYQRMQDLFSKLDNEGFFEADGLGSTKSGQTYLWNALNALLGSKGKTPAADWKKDDNGFTPWGRRGGGGRSGSRAAIKFGDRNNKGLQWSPVKARQMAAVKTGKYTPAQFKVKLNNQVKRDKTQNYSDRTI